MNVTFFKLFWYKIFVNWKLKLLNFMMDSILIFNLKSSISTNLSHNVTFWNDLFPCTTGGENFSSVDLRGAWSKSLAVFDVMWNSPFASQANITIKANYYFPEISSWRQRKHTHVMTMLLHTINSSSFDHGFLKAVDFVLRGTKCPPLHRNL